MAYTERIISTVQELTGKKHILLTARCNAAIMLALKIAKQNGYTSVTIPDWGGWMTYEQFAIKLKLPLFKMKTEDGKIDVKKLQLAPKTILLVHSLAGYHWRLDTKTLAAIAKRDGAFFIEDICGTIGEPATFGDVVVCSFGSAKPVNFGNGGFFATNDPGIFAAASALQGDALEFEFQALLDKLTAINLQKRKQYLFDVREQMRAALFKAGFESEGDQKALVLIVPYTTSEQKDAIVGLCASNGVEYTQCPRYIRSGKQAISVEIKRL